MKKIVSLLLVVTLTLSLCACNNNPYPSNFFVDVTSNEHEVIEFTDVVLVDDEIVTIELLNFFSEEVNWADEGLLNEKNITIKVTNKTNHKIFMSDCDFYLNGEQMWCGPHSGLHLEPQKTGQDAYYVGKNYLSGHKALDSLDELYDLEGQFVIKIDLDDKGVYTDYPVTFSIKSAINKG